MNCVEIQEQLVAYVEGLLEEDLHKHVQAHLDQCPTCREELKAIQGLYSRLVADSQSYVNDEMETRVIDRIFREQQFQLRCADKTPDRRRLRRLIMSRFGKLAVAAVALIAVMAGIILFHGTSVNLKAVQEKLNAITTITYRITMTMSGFPGMPKDKPMKMEMEAYISAEYGIRMDSTTHVAGADIEQSTFVSIKDGAVISLIPSQKKYVKITLTDDLFDQMKKENGDPRAIVDTFLEKGYTSLGRREINGITVEGFESDQAPVTKVLSAGSGIGRVWVDVKTHMPVLVEMETTAEDGSQSVLMTIDNFQFNTPLAADLFAVTIPDGYEAFMETDMALGSLAENLAEGLKFFVKLSRGRYPKALGTMEISQELGAIVESWKDDKSKIPDEEETEKDAMSAVMKLTMSCTSLAMMSAEGKDVAYYGETVGPNDVDRILVRWKEDNGNYTVIYGDLRVEEVGPEKLAELEK
ncbi:MAG: zf-HC2 domain-containing protein [Sedimentisphaerales bacterium]|nr:zf-HC2 domain-containing protein [Sedimentisphaerales bacterium]